jgi:ariadne-1
MSGSGSEGGEWFDDFDDSLTASDSDAGGAAAAEASPARGGAQRVPLYRVLDAAELEAAATAATDQVRAILGCAAAAARALLAPFGWDAEALLTTLAERGEAAVYGRAGLPPPGAAPAAPPAPDAAGAAACGVCLADVPARELLAPAACGHSFCRECWATHAAVAVRGGLGAALRCMAPRCGAPVADAAAEALLAGAEGGALAARRRRQLLDAFVDGNRAVRWCPSVPHCGRAARAARGPHVECDCACGARFCFACGEAPHSPASCAMMADWARRLREGTETSQWLSAHTKPCPRCAKPVEKNGGCNLVLCRCGQAFCWLCGRGTGRAHTWTAIEGHACGAYRGEAESRASGAQR